ncbi:MAG: TetR/AcrR family transcriptional regulator [Nostoc indistinguendum CM1-VF10]|jgi:AcrR family transcriptional regulator|nr:TetR/AcrR family transcriptional regulator [Nostoc indistinguendum CM1-VF10]
MNNARKNSLGRPRSTQSHQAILQATLELLAEVGFERITVDAIASRAKAGKSTIYRRYNSKGELVADAIESLREEIVIPDTGTLWSDIDALIASAAQNTLNPLGRRTVAMIISSASSDPEFAHIYWTKYLQPRRQAFAIIIERAKVRQEIEADIDPALVFDTMSGIMLYAQIFQPTPELWEAFVRSALHLIIKKPLS